MQGPFIPALAFGILPTLSYYKCVGKVWQDGPQNVHILIPRTFHGKGTLLMDSVKDLEMRDDPGLSRWALSVITRVLCEREAGGSELEEI